MIFVFNCAPRNERIDYPISRTKKKRLSNHKFITKYMEIEFLAKKKKLSTWKQVSNHAWLVFQVDSVCSLASLATLEITNQPTTRHLRLSFSASLLSPKNKFWMS